MATASVSKLPSMDLSFIALDTENTRPSIVKETSTVGDLISFTDRGPRRSSPEKFNREFSRRRRSSSGNDFGTNGSRSSRSENGVGKHGRRRGSLQRSRSLNRELYKGRRSSIGYLERQLSTESKSGDDESPPNTTRRRKTRRSSMMDALREDLEKIPCLRALRRRTSSVVEEEEDGNVFQDSDADDSDGGSQFLGRSRRASSIYRRDSSAGSGPGGTLTESELKKIRMLNTLNKMDGKNNNICDRKRSMDSQSGELAVLEASFLKGKKRGSIATRVLLKTRTRKPQPGELGKVRADQILNDSPSPTNRPESQELSEAQKERSQKIFQMLKKAEKPKLIGLIGKDKDSITKEDVAKESMLSFRRKLRRKKMQPIQVFRKRAKFVVLLLRAWKIHSNNINEILVDNNESLDMITRGNQADLMFDITTFKASKEAMISPEVKRILMKSPKTRTEDEQYYVQIFLRNYKSIAEYPVKMQKMIAQRSWIESYDIKRVIVREGHVPMCFYFLLSGSAIVSAMENGMPKTIMFLNRGDSFGDIAILNNARRETTVISREKIELLCMTDEDFVDIFMSGGMQDPNDPFLKSINFLDGWPREKLIDNPKKCIFSYFKRGTILVNDTNNNDWIFVVKSGSASVLKRLQAVDLTRKIKQQKLLDFREEVLATTRHEGYLSHEEQIQLMCEEEKRSLDDQNLHVRFYALPEINVKTNDSYNELRQMKEEYMNANTVNRALGALEKLADAGVDVKSEAGNSGSMTNASSRKAQSLRRKSIANAVLKGPFIKNTSGGLGREQSFASMPSHRELDSRGTASRNSRRSSGSKGKVSFREEEEYIRSGDVDNKKKVDDWQEMSLPSLAASPINDLTIRPPEKLPIFVEIQNLTKGQVFGIAETLYENQPNFSLVSNGAECIMIEKKFFLENASQSLMVRLREMTYPYPSNEALQATLELHMRWDSHKQLQLNKILREVKLRRKDPNDARSTLRLPPLTA